MAFPRLRPVVAGRRGVNPIEAAQPIVRFRPGLSPTSRARSDEPGAPPGDRSEGPNRPAGRRDHEEHEEEPDQKEARLDPAAVRR